MTKEMVYQSLAKVLGYPHEGYRASVRECRELIGIHYPDQVSKFSEFDTYVETALNAAVEELYVNTFDVQALCSLDIGYVIFGEDYKRGEMLTNMKVMQTKFGNDCGTELPDHLPNVLTLITKLNWNDSRDLVAYLVLSALEKMLQGFQEKGSPYQHVLFAIDQILRADFDCIPAVISFRKEGLDLNDDLSV